MSLTPKEIFQSVKSHKLSNREGILQLKTFLETSRDPEFRLDCLICLKSLNVSDKSIFPLLENLLISDMYEKIRTYAAIFLREKYIHRAFLPMSWAIHYEKDYFCQIEIIKTIAQIGNDAAKKALIKALEEIFSNSHINNQYMYPNQSFIDSIKEKYEDWHEELSISQLEEILINYKTISNLIKRFYYVFFEWENGLVKKLDLSELGWNVSRSWKLVYANKIVDLQEVQEIYNLKHLKILDLSNNRLRSIMGLEKLPYITHLHLRNNILQDHKNIDYLKKMKHLRYIDVRGNEIASHIDRNDFSDIDLIMKNYLVFM